MVTNKGQHTLLLSLSGGMDSATLLGWALAHGYNPLCIMFNYGSKHNAFEETAFMLLRNHYKVGGQIMYISDVLQNTESNLLKKGGAIPEGHYAEESMKLTVVPGRNLLFISILASIAESRGIPRIWLGMHAGDHAIYPDCRPEFVQAARDVVMYSTDGKVTVEAPFLTLDKTGILTKGFDIPNGMNVPYHLTRTCYKKQPIACGKCGSCQERLEAFHNLGVEDPIEYESRELFPKKEA